MRLTLLAAGVLAVGCGPRPQEPPALVSPGGLVRCYRDTPGLAATAYTDRPVTCHLAPGTYAVEGGEVHFLSGFEGTPPAVVFVCDGPAPEDANHPVRVTGTCRGVVRDKVRRSPGVDFYVLVTGCTWSAH